MKVTICFDGVKVIVPCGKSKSNDLRLVKDSESVLQSGQLPPLKSKDSVDTHELGDLRVSDVIDNAVARFKKATAKVIFYFFKFNNSFCIFVSVFRYTETDTKIIDFSVLVSY